MSLARGPRKKMVDENGIPFMPRNFMVTLTIEQAKFVHQWMLAEQARSPQDAIRMIVEMALNADAQRGADHARSMRAYFETRRWVTERVMGSFKEILDILQKSLREMDGHQE